MAGRPLRRALAAGLVTAGLAVIALAGCTSGGTGTPGGAATGTGTSGMGTQAPAPPGTITAAPQAPPARVCGNRSVLNGPATAPKGATVVPAGDNSGVNFALPRTTYWFAPGVHTLGTGQYANIDPADDDTYVGAPGAILDGQHANDSAFDDTSAHVRIEYLTIRDFGTWGGDQQQGVVNHDSGPDWTISHSTIEGNAGAGVMLGSGDSLSWDCLSGNQQYGFSAYSGNGAVTGLTLDHNEIAGNDTYDYEAKQPGCGCSGGGKFWNVIDATVTSNWVHGNGSVGLWADTDNAGFEFAGNYISGNQGVGLQYEISYNALIEDNTFVRNGVTGGPANPGFPTSAVYISESGNDSRVNSRYKDSPMLIAHNVFLDNWGGVILWENSNRFCGSPDNSSSGYCTMTDPKATLKSCATPALIKAQPYVSDCRWKTQDVRVEDNSFSFTPAAVGKACTASSNCGYNGVFSEYGSSPSWSPYQGDIVPVDITFRQGNEFSGNDYSGPWCFMGWQQGTAVSFSQWQAPASVAKKQFGQDRGSSYRGPARSCG